MTIQGSSDISVLAVQVTFDISGPVPVVSLVNRSIGANLQLCSWAFTVLSPSLTPIHQGDINSPDIAPAGSAWTTFSLTDTWPTNPFNSYQIEWSGSPYIFYVTVKDNAGNVYSTQSAPQQALILPPPNSTPIVKNFYGLASSTVNVQCAQGAVYFVNNTDYVYQGYAGTKISSTIVVTYPPDKNGATATPFTLLNYSSALVPVTQNSPAYIFTQNAVYNYEVATLTNIKLNYYQQASFGVWCGIDLLPLNAVICKFFDKIQNNDFTDMASAQKRGLLILAEYSLILAGILQPLSGAIDIPYHIKNIEALTGFACFDDCCCGAQSGIIPSSGSSIIGDYNFVLNQSGNINNSSIVQTGNNIVFNLNGYIYVVDVTNNSPGDFTSISVTPETVGNTKYFHITVDGRQMAIDLAGIIENDAEVYNLWQALFNQNPEFKIAVDGKCIFTTSNACDYLFTLYNIPLNTTYALLTGITVGSAVTPLSFSFNITNLAALQTYLNGLGLGTFVVVPPGVPGSGTITITSTANTNNITALNYSIAGTAYTADLARQCTGYEEVEAQYAIQQMINYMCALADSQVATSAEYTICYIDAKGAKQTTVIAAGQSVATFIAALLAAGCTTIDYLISNGGGGGANCNALAGIFLPTSALIDENTLLYGYKNGCAGITPMEIFRYMLTNMDSSTLTLFCNAVAACGSGLTCENFDFDVLVTEHNTSCSNIVGIIYDLS